MRVFENREFHSDFDDRDSGAVFEDVEFRRCYFQGCSLSITLDPRLRTTVRNIRLIGCSQRGGHLGAAVVEDVLVDGFNTHGQGFQTWGAVFNRVVLRGKIDRLMISSVVAPGVADVEEQCAFDETNARYYEGVEWALDISQGEFRELDIRGVPSELIRRDPATQAVVTRAAALQGNWRELEYRSNLWPVTLDLFLQSEERSVVLVAAKRNRRFREYLADLNTLRDAGITEPD
jgi:hypothetical protein